MAAIRTLHSFALGVALLALLCFGCASAASSTYLSPSGAPEWDGNCDTGCSSEQPCGLPATAVSATSAKKTCSLNFLGGKYTTPVSIKQAQDATTLGVIFAANDGGVQGISLSLMAKNVAYSGNVSFGVLTVSLEATETVKINGLWSIASSFNFVGDSAPSVATAVNVAKSFLNYLPPDGITEKEIVSIFVRRPRFSRLWDLIRVSAAFYCCMLELRIALLTLCYPIFYLSTPSSCLSA